MKVDKRFVPHIIVLGIILVVLLIFLLLFANASKVPESISINQENLLDGGENDNSILYEHTEKQTHRDMTMQDVLTKATKRIVIKSE